MVLVFVGAILLVISQLLDSNDNYKEWSKQLTDSSCSWPTPVPEITSCDASGWRLRYYDKSKTAQDNYNYCMNKTVSLSQNKFATG